MAKRKRKPVKPLKVQTYTVEELDQLDGPTDERRARGAWVQHKSQDRTERYERDMASTPIDQLEWMGAITTEQAQAGRDYERLVARCRLVSAGRSCLDMSPIGYGDGDQDDARAWQSLTELDAKLGPYRSGLLRRVICAPELPPMRHKQDRDKLPEALDVCIAHFQRRRA